MQPLRLRAACIGLEPLKHSEAMKLLERLELAAALMTDVPDVTGQKMAVGSRHRLSLGSVRFNAKNER